MKESNEIEMRLQKQFKQVQLHFRKRTPITLLLGHHRSGKSALLEKSTLEFTILPTRISANHKNRNTFTTRSTVITRSTMEHHEHDTDKYLNEWESPSMCYWYLHHHHIIVDTPGDYANSEIGTSTQTPWKSLLNILKKNHRRFPVEGIIVTINVAELASQQKQQTRLQIHLLKQRILDLHKAFHHPIPLTLVFTKCDLISGFREYFDNLSLEEREGALSIALQAEKNYSTLTHQFKQAYLELLQQISQHIINRLHQEHNPDKRQLIKDFPNQLEQLSDLLAYVVNNLAEKTYDCDASRPHTIYFTSSEQVGKPSDFLDETLNQTFSIVQHGLSPITPTFSKPYFIKPIFEKLISNGPLSMPTQGIEFRKNWPHYSIYTAGCLIALISSTLIINHFKANLLAANKAEAELIRNHLAEPIHSTPQTLIGAITQNNLSANAPAQTPIKEVLSQKSMLTDLLPQLQIAIELQLKDSRTSPPQLYDTFKVYLMLGNPSRINANFLVNWIQQQTSNNHLNSLINDVNARLALVNALTHHLHPISLQADIVAEVQHTLNSLPKSYLAYLILQSSAEETINPAASLTNTIITAKKNIAIPYLYTAFGLQTQFLNSYQNAVNEAKYGNWITGKSASTKSDDITIITQQLMNLYARDYASWWGQSLDQLQLTPSNDLPHIAALINFLAKSPEGLLPFLQYVQRNTDSNILLPTSVNRADINFLRHALSSALGERFQAVNELAHNPSLATIFSQFNQYLQTIINASDPKQAAFITTTKRFQNLGSNEPLDLMNQVANHLPPPFNTWIRQVNIATWKALIAQSQIFIQQQWQNNVVAFYNNNLRDNYPFIKSAAADVDLAAFSRFFAPRGLFNEFFSTYVAPFVDMHQSQWTWKVVDGVRISNDDTILETFERGRIITSMFYANDNANPSITFSLEQTAMMPIVKSLIININGQTSTDIQGTRNINTFIWPGNNTDMNVSLTFNNVNGQRATISHNGPWAWFRVLDQAQIQATSDPQKFNMTFDIDGNEAKYTLAANSPINPFIPGIIDGFKVPESF